MADLREIDVPPHIKNNDVISEIYRVGDKFAGQWYDDIDSVNDDIFIATSTERGIARREAMLKIIPLDTETLDARRARVMMRWYDRTPYTKIVIERRIKATCGEGNYVITYDAENMYLDILLREVDDVTLYTIAQELEELINLQLILNIRNQIQGAAEVTEYVDLVYCGGYTEEPVITIDDSVKIIEYIDLVNSGGYIKEPVITIDNGGVR